MARRLAAPRRSIDNTSLTRRSASCARPTALSSMQPRAIRLRSNPRLGPDLPQALQLDRPPRRRPLESIRDPGRTGIPKGHGSERAAYRVTTDGVRTPSRRTGSHAIVDRGTSPAPRPSHSTSPALRPAGANRHRSLRPRPAQSVDADETGSTPHALRRVVAAAHQRTRDH